ncbi:putative ribonuclease H protein [Glycine soja]|uniref:Putative ribonuclease H protein n=1 Tax=Glycine soja TaxID=3848 RepID=A0A445LWQ7_GLYSO|nr:putative ribonuclease H protein [Glycine soja]
MMERMGFCLKWRRWIKACNQSATISILINGSPSKEFAPTRGLRQGDPLAPLLFNIVAEGLNGMMRTALNKGLYSSYLVGKQKVPINILQYADDTIFVGEATWDNVIAMKTMLRGFELASGLKINFSKSSVGIFGAHSNWVQEAARFLNCRTMETPFLYLGIPLGAKHSSWMVWEPLIKKFESKLSKWNQRFLSMAGKELSMGGGGDSEHKKIAWVNWNNICLPKEFGGLGIKDINRFNAALLGRWIWDLSSNQDQLWVRTLSSKYGGWTDLINGRDRPWHSQWWKDLRKLVKQPEFSPIIQHMEWKVGDGSLINFWKDKWLGTGSNLDQQFNQMFLISRQQNSKICDMGSLSHGTWRWDLKWRRNLFDHEHAEAVTFMELISNVQIQPHVKDSLRWSADPSGIYSSKSAYRLLISVNRDIPQPNIYNLFWRLNIPPRAAVFAWRILKNRDNNSGGWQVDVDMLDGLLSSLVEYLQLENAYNIFILNPKRDEKKPKYGYRRGLSEPEINLLKENKSLQMKLLQPEGIPENILALTKIQRPLYLKHPMMKFSWTRTEDTDICKVEAVDVLDSQTPFFFWETDCLPFDPSNLVLVRSTTPKKSALIPQLTPPNYAELSFRKLGQCNKRELYIFMKCLLFCYNYKMQIEWYNIWLDALDNFGRLYQGRDTAEIIEVKALQLLKGKDQDLKLHLEKVLKSGDYSGFQAECLTDTWIGKDRWAFIDLSAGPFSWGPAVGGEGVRTEASLPSVEKTIGSASEISEEEAEDRLQDAIQEKFAVFGDKEHQAIDILLAEIDIYELFAFKHCKGRKVKLALCEELDERMRDLRNELQSFEGEEYDESHKKKAIEALKRMESWNLFSDTYEEFQNYTVARDSFLAHLGATLWGSMRHIVSPSVADGAFHYYEKISFQLFFMTQEKVRHIKQLPVDMKAIMDGFSSLMVPSQKPMFSPHVLPLSEDPALAMAFAVARRAAAVPLLLINGTYRKTVRTYLDSSILQYQLQRLNKHGSLKASLDFNFLEIIGMLTVSNTDWNRLTRNSGLKPRQKGLILLLPKQKLKRSNTSITIGNGDVSGRNLRFSEKMKKTTPFENKFNLLTPKEIIGIVKLLKAKQPLAATETSVAGWIEVAIVVSAIAPEQDDAIAGSVAVSQPRLGFRKKTKNTLMLPSCRIVVDFPCAVVTPLC